MPRLAFLGGVAEVGGNKVMLEHEGHILFLDFGISYKRRGYYYEEYVNPRAALGLLDLLEMRLLPPLEGLYRPDLHPPSPSGSATGSCPPTATCGGRRWRGSYAPMPT